MTYIHTEKD